jgi:hypothetical protein
MTPVRRLKHDISKKDIVSKYNMAGFILLVSAMAVCSDPGSVSRTGFLRADGLLADYRVNPLGIDRRPNLSWRMEAGGRHGAAQTAYRIRSASSAEHFGVGNILWDSGLMESNASTQIPYGGPVLQPGERVWWQVQIRDENGRSSDWSEPAWFEAGLPAENDWRGAQWIGCDRKMDEPEMAPREIMGPWIAANGEGAVEAFTVEFELPDVPVVSAMAYWGVSGRGVKPVVSIKGRIRPGVARRAVRGGRRYVDLSFQLNPGHVNVLRMDLDPASKDTKVCFGMRLDYTDGRTGFVASGSGWEFKEGGLREANTFLGERMDYRLEHDEWKTPAVGTGWKPVQIVPTEVPRLIASDFPPVRRLREIRPVKQWRVGEKAWLFDAGENIAGWVRLAFHEPEGSTVRIRYSEMARDGRLWNVPESHWWVHGMAQHDGIISDGQPRVYETRFAYKGFRYFEISGLSREPAPGEVLACQIGNDAPRTATFESSDPLLNRLFENGMRSHYGNMLNSLLDYPHREKCLWGGYGEDALRMMRNTEVVGPAHSIVHHDATTFWETFNPDVERQVERSLNHHAINHPAAWLVTDLAGIRLDEAVPGGRRLILAPFMPGSGSLDRVKASMRTPHGLVESAWRTADGAFEWSFAVPANVTAEVRIPAQDGTEIRGAETMRLLGREDGCAVYEATSGSYAVRSHPELNQ